MHRKKSSELGFPGFVFPDTSGKQHALASAINGLDYGSSSIWSTSTIEGYLKQHNMTEARLNDMAIRNLIGYYYVNLDNGTQPLTAEQDAYVDVRGNYAKLIRSHGSKSMALLKNENNALPLNKPHKMAIFGSHARAAIAGPNMEFSVEGSSPVYDGHLATDSGSGQGSLPYLITPETAFTIKAAQDGTMLHWVANGFARNLNLRLVVNNTGHAFAVKASGKGGLTIWTHFLKDKEYYPSFKAANGYTGPAINFGSVVQVFEAYEFAKSVGHFVVGGEAVPLNRELNVFWMLRGGGGSTIGVVTSLTVNALASIGKTTTVTFNFTVHGTPGPDSFWSAVKAYLDHFETFVDAGTYGYYYIGASSAEIGTTYKGDTNYYFRMESHYAWVEAFPREYVGTDVGKTASRLLPRNVFQSDDLRDQTWAAYKDAVEQCSSSPASTSAELASPSNHQQIPPSTQHAMTHIIVGSEWYFTSTWDVVKSQTFFVTEWMDVLRKIAPDSGAT
ncbi:CAZyme family AA7 [Penicillium argentinense]|uniref:beta-glucosidase n=1 Tax=Penicillium argentinense TaxID=1131581 RepID=A0A9W9G2Z3_9EURO|nr:CAZyme family AA7 [Penicillium argentinense]KAJ5111146.1 CAZyme family AA7 [Penicillium argentinense]